MKEEIRRIQEVMERQAYITDRSVATAVPFASALGEPLLADGHPGVGKTEVAQVLSRVLATDLVRLQC